jgi:hypothetical protein
MADKIGEKLATWTKRTLVYVTSTPDKIKEILELPHKSFLTVPIEQLEESLMALSHYALFLSNEFNIARSRHKYFSMLFNDRLAKVFVANTIEGRSKEERAMTACQIDSELDKLRERVEEYKMKADRIEGLPISINVHVSIIRDIYKRRIGERR